MNTEYIPQPVNTSEVKLPAGVTEIAELLAKNTHDVWAKQRRAEGWKQGVERNDERKEHPCLVPYEDLPENEKAYDRNTALETIRFLLHSGYEITPVCGKTAVKLPNNVILDNGQGNISLPDKRTPTLWASNSVLPDRELFNSVASRCFLMLDADVLRNNGAMISKSISWERSVMNLIWQLNNNTAISYLLKAPHILIPFEDDAVVYLKTGKLGNKHIIKSASMVLADGSCEGTQRRKPLSGNGFVAMVAAAARQFTDVVNETKMLQLTPILKNNNVEKESDDEENLIPIPVLEDGNTIDPGTWLIANSKKEKDMHELAVNYIKYGDDSLKGKGFPFLKMGGLKSIDRFEIEGFHNIRNLIEAYANKKFSKGEDITPLSIAVFGSPGSGKSFGVKQIAKSLGDSNNKTDTVNVAQTGSDDELGTAFIKTDTVNVAQTGSDDELGAAFQKVRDIVFEDKLPLVFFDEFDSGELKWLKNFLMPMQVGKFKDASGEHPLGKCILVFAGGTASTFRDFIAPMSSADEQVQRTFKNVKGPDFASRIKGTIDIAGPNRRDDSDNAYILRRALLLRSLCEHDERLKENVKAGKNFIDENILRAMLYVPEYKHGVRSMETIFKMSKIENSVWQPSGLPMGNQMSVHLDDRKFTDILLLPIIENSLEGVMAKAIHERFVKYMDENRRKRPNAKPWEELAIEFKLSNLNQARSYSEKLALIQCEMTLKDENRKAVTAFTDEEVLRMAEQEHQRWMYEKIEDNWVYAPVRNDRKKHHDCLVEWDKLTEEEQNRDKESVRNMIGILDHVGYGVYRKE
ncbi:MAG: hypothetical protein LBR86_06715 [Tannerella sp.]|jgi:hypothetical protein|nr:hypothetical protein [Tannerella sp.]